MRELLSRIRNSGILLELVDGELKLFASDANVDKALLQEIKERKAELRAFLAEHTGAHTAAENKALRVVAQQEDYVLSSSQRRLWILNQLDPGNTAYNMPGVYVFDGALNIDALGQAFATLVERHESLRTVFKVNADGEVRQVILPATASGFFIARYDLRQAPDPAAAMQQQIQQHAAMPFDLATGPLLQTALLQTADKQWVFCYVMHHIISDGWSMGLMLNELLVLYNAYNSGMPNPLPPLRIQYKDYAAWQQQELSGTALQQHKAYWLGQFAGELPVLDLPADKVRPAVQTFNGAVVGKAIHALLAREIKALAQREGATLFMALLASVNALFNRYTGQEDIILGTPIAGREHPDLQQQIGFYVNTLVLRTRFEHGDSFRSLLQAVKTVTLGAYEHQVFPFDELVECLDLRRDMSRNPLFDVMVVMQNPDSPESGAAPAAQQQPVAEDAVQIAEYGGGGGPVVSKFDMSIGFAPIGEEIHLNIEYNTDIYSHETATQMAGHLVQLLAQAVLHPDTPIAELAYLTASEKQYLIEGLNDTVLPYDANVTVADMIAAQTAAMPDAIAIETESGTMTYRQFNETANRLAHWLRLEQGVQPNELIGIQLERSVYLPAVMLGVLKSGAAYVPIDTAYPQERIDYLLNDSQCKLLIDEKALAAFLEKATAYDAGNPAPVGGPGDLAYIIYTSGSTGQPKGVMITQGNLAAFLHWSRKEFNDADFDVTFAATSVCFDLSAFEIYHTLVTGKKIRLLADGMAIQQHLHRPEKILLNTVPSVVVALLRQQADLGNVTVLNMAGEAIPEPLIKQLDTTRIAVRNLYGPSEDTTYSTVYRFAKDSTVLIGRPIGNTQVYIVDTHGQPCPLGVMGELWLGGDGVAKGYLHRPEATAEKFIDNPFTAKGKIYKTGDFGCWRHNGQLALAGRKDAQVKIRGYRIELGEVEAALQAHPSVEMAAVVVREMADGDKDMVAFFTATQPTEADTLRSYLAYALPAYMVPGIFAQLDAMPLTLNGKIDRKRLPGAEGLGRAGAAEYLAPRNETEAKLAQLWQEVLGRERVGAKDHFFALGGHSLRATRLAGLLHKTFEVQVPLRQLFDHPVLEDQARLIAQAQQTAFVAIEPIPYNEGGYLLSSPQRRLWVLSQFEQSSIAYNIPGVYAFEGPLHIEALQAAFVQLLQRHESLRTVFGQNEEGELRQFVKPLDQLGFGVGMADLRTAADTAAALHTALAADAARPFDLATGPLIRVTLYQVADHNWVLSYCMHHIISDGWSMGILANEVSLLYQANATGMGNPLPPLRIQYKDYAAWQQQQLSGDALQQHKAYWLGQFAGELPVLELPGDHARPAVKTYNGGSLVKMIGAAATTGIRQACGQQGATLFMGLLAAIKALLYRYTGQTDIVVGSPIAGREHADLHDQIGFYLNTLALRTRFSGNDTFGVLLQQVQTVAMAAFEHQVYPFDELVDELDLKRDMSRSALFDVMVVLQNNETGTPSTAVNLPSTAVNPSPTAVNPPSTAHAPVSKFDITFNITETGNELQVAAEYNSDIYSAATIKQLLAHLEQLMLAVTAHPATPIAQLEYLTATEKTQLLQTFNDTARDFPQDKTMVDLFEAQTAALPMQTAVVYGPVSLTYADLNEQANRLAHCLRSEHGIGTGDSVAVCLPRTHWLMVAIMGILKSGAGYVPIEPDYPQERIDYLIKDSGSKWVIDEAFVQQFEQKQTQYSAANPALAATPDSLAYTIYTSGSTGMPKGVMVQHRNIVNYTHWFIQQYNINNSDATLLLSSITFDGVLTSVFGALLSGATLHVLPKELPQSPLALAGYIHEQQITFIKITPPPLHLMVADAASFALLQQAPKLRLVVCGGESMNRADVQQIMQQLPHVTVVNHYGPTETTVGCLAAPVQDTDGEIPVGRPIFNTEAYVLDAQQQLVPPMVLGEIYIGGAGVAIGYRNNPALTAEKYLPNPFRPGHTLYRTGDMGRWLPDGRIVFLGRRDHQVKIRGYRIELGEIEAALQKHPAISAAVVTARNMGGENELAAYVIATETLNAQELRSWLKTQLPDYMVPAWFVQLDAFPLNTSGKVDRKALPSPETDGLGTGVAYVPPGNETEAKLVAIWADVLGRDKATIGIKDNFFDLGGHSLKATKLVARVYKELDTKMPLQEAFLKPVLEEQAQWIAAAAKTRYQAIEPLPLQPHYALSPAQRRLWVLSQFEEGNLAYNMPGLYHFEGQIDRAALAYAFGELIDRHESLRTVFREDEGGEPRQFILPPGQSGFAIAHHNLTGTTGQEAQVQALAQANAATPFNLATGPLLRVGLYETDGNKWVINYVMHHIISDGVSMELLIGELLQLYAAYMAGAPNPLPPLRIQYKDYAAWQLQQLSGEQLEWHKNYWLQQLEGELPVLDLPGDKPRPAMKTYNGGAVGHFIGTETTQGLQKLVQAQGGTLFMGLLATINALLFKYTGQTDIVVGTQIAGREHPDLENQIGFYLNTLALRNRFAATDSFEALLAQAKQVMLGAYEHQVYPFDELVDALSLRRNLSRNALYDVSLILHNTKQTATGPAPEGEPALKMGGYEGSAATAAKFDLAFDFAETDGGLMATIVYNSDIFHHETAVRMMAHLQQLLDAMLQQPAAPMASIDYCTDAERQQLLYGFNDTAIPYPANTTIADLFEEQVAKTPDAIALVFEDKVHTYQQLNELSNRLAAYLVAGHGVQPEDCVALLLDRSDMLLVAILGVLKAGAAYVPIDPDNPKGRQAFICNDTAAKVLLTQSQYLLDIDFFNGGVVALDIQLPEMPLPERPPVANAGPHSLAYVLYTSGSTGNPKGVLVENRSVVRLVKPASFVQLTGSEVLLSTGAVSFDATTFEYWAMLLNGGTLVMCSKATLLNDEQLVAGIKAHQVDTMWFTSGWLNQLVEKNLPVSEGLKTILVGGDKLSPVHISALKSHYPSLTVINGYGPTENTTFSLTHTVQTVTDRIPIGKPIGNSTAYIIKGSGLAPVGVVGEICVGGDGLARGYLNQPALTAEKFVDNPFVPGTRMYRTGDLGRWLPDGTIEFMGRNDEQVKIRGYRIEPGEVEQALLQHPAIDNAVVVVKTMPDGEKEMVAYIAAQTELNATALAGHLTQRLPAYMVPAFFVQLDSLPLTHNGKVDRKQLPDPEGAGLGSAAPYVPPGNETEERLVAIWQEILGREPIGIKDNFFDLGGHSLKATRLLSKINMDFGVSIGIQTIFQEPTIESIAQRIVFVQSQERQQKDMDDMQEVEI
jgi:tyrocidine synthetase III